jgi:cytochrome P450
MCLTSPENLAQYYWPNFTLFLGKLAKARPSPLANQYVYSTCKKPSAGENTLLHKLQKSKTFSQIQVAAECMDHMAAGIDTTGDALSFLLYQLSLPESWNVQEKLAQEFRENEGKSLDELRYLDAVVKEGLRCFPPIPMSQPRYVPEGGRTIDGYVVPGGTIVSAQAWSVHRLNEDVYPDGSKFVPERWLDEVTGLDMNRLFFAFGLGARGCTGRQ